MYTKKRGFTLAEILIVLTVIGVIATITLPQLTGGVDEAQCKAGLKKAYSTIANIAAIQASENNLPTSATKEAAFDFFSAISENIKVEGYSTAAVATTSPSSKVTPDSIKGAVTWNSVSFGDTTGGTLSGSALGDTTWSPWVVATDEMAYSTLKGGGCGTMAAINKSDTTAGSAMASACVVVIVDVNGLQKGPNLLEPQAAADKVSGNVRLKKLTGDRFYIYIGKDGAARGSANNTITGRLLAGIK